MIVPAVRRRSVACASTAIFVSAPATQAVAFPGTDASDRLYEIAGAARPPECDGGWKTGDERLGLA